MIFEIGETYRISKGGGEYHKIHILAIVDEQYIAFKWYGKHKQWWHYEIEHAEMLELMVNRAANKP